MREKPPSKRCRIRSRGSARQGATSWENMLLPYANNKATDQPARPRSLISAFVVRCLDRIIPILAIAKISRLASLCSWAGRFGSYLVETPEDRFSHDKAHTELEEVSDKEPHLLPFDWQHMMCLSRISTGMMLRSLFLMRSLKWASLYIIYTISFMPSKLLHKKNISYIMCGYMHFNDHWVSGVNTTISD